MQRICIKNIQTDVQIGESVCSVFLVGSAQKSEGRNGPFWSVKLRDASGILEAKIWSPLSQNVGELKAGDFIEVRGRTSLFREQLQFTIEALRFVEDPEELDMSAFMQTSATPPSEILAQIEECVDQEIAFSVAQSPIYKPIVKCQMCRVAPASYLSLHF